MVQLGLLLLDGVFDFLAPIIIKRLDPLDMLLLHGGHLPIPLFVQLLQFLGGLHILRGHFLLPVLVEL